jgi:hypothetical protein
MAKKNLKKLKTTTKRAIKAQIQKDKKTQNSL